MNFFSLHKQCFVHSNWTCFRYCSRSRLVAEHDLNDNVKTNKVCDLYIKVTEYKLGIFFCISFNLFEIMIFSLLKFIISCYLSTFENLTNLSNFLFFLLIDILKFMKFLSHSLLKKCIYYLLVTYIGMHVCVHCMYRE